MVSIEVQQLVDVINKMNANQESANLRFDEHLTKLRENVHEIKNDYHGVASLSQITHGKVKDMHVKLEKETTVIHSRIDKTTNNLDSIKKELSDFKPVVDSVKTVTGNVSKIVTGVVVAAILWAIVQMNSGG